MKYRLQITAAATTDLEDAAIWYEDQRAGLGPKFLRAVQKGLSVIQSAPNRYIFADDSKTRRRYLLPAPFSTYMIIYYTEDDLITVSAIFHTSRDPKRWLAEDEF